MARKEIPRYIRYYTDGSAARQLELPGNPQPGRRPKKANKPQVVLVDGLVVVGLAVAAVMAVCLIAGSIMMARAEYEMNALQAYVTQMQEENRRLQAEYEQGYDLADIQTSAEAMGLVSAEEVRHITVDVPRIAPEPRELTWWQQLVEDIKALFA